MQSHAFVFNCYYLDSDTGQGATSSATYPTSSQPVVSEEVGDRATPELHSEMECGVSKQAPDGAGA